MTRTATGKSATAATASPFLYAIIVTMEEAAPIARTPWTRLESLQRPVIEDQEDEEKRHQHRLAQQAKGKTRDDDEISSNTGRPRIAPVSPHRRHPEKSTQDILSFRNPHHGFHVGRMHREERGDDPGTGHIACHPEQDPEQRERT